MLDLDFATLKYAKCPCFFVIFNKGILSETTENPTTVNYIWVVKQSAHSLLLHNDYGWFAVFMPLPCNGRIRQVVCCHSNKGRFCSNRNHLRTVTRTDMSMSPNFSWIINMLLFSLLSHFSFCPQKHWKLVTRKIVMVAIVTTYKHIQKYLRSEDLLIHWTVTVRTRYKICILAIHNYWIKIKLCDIHLPVLWLYMLQVYPVFLCYMGQFFPFIHA